MALRKRLNEQIANWPLPIRGVNLQVEQSLLARDEAAKLENFVIDGALRNRTGSTGINSTSLGAFRISGGTKYYYGGSINPTSKRIIAYGTNLSELKDTGTEISLTTGMASDKDTHFRSWSITDTLYISNGSDTLRSYDGNTDTFATVSGTNIPSPIQVVPVLDRLLALTPQGIERSSTVLDTDWSSDSAWATFRPSKGGRFTAMHPFALRGTDSILHGAVAFQPSAWYLITATNFGSTTASQAAQDANDGDDSRIILMDDGVGTSSPYGIAEVPELGLFWVTSDLNVYFLPYGTLRGQYVGNRIRSVTDVQGIESMGLNNLSQAWLVYKYPYLMLGIPTRVRYATIQYWMDIRVFAQAGPVWYGPMMGQSLSRCWVEQELADDYVYAGEGNATTGAFVYRVRNNAYTDTVGTTTNNITSKWLTFYNDFEAPDKEKLIRSLHFDINAHTGTAKLDIYDIDGIQKNDLAIERFTEF